MSDLFDEDDDLKQALIRVRKKKCTKKFLKYAFIVLIATFFVGGIWYTGYRSAIRHSDAKIEAAYRERDEAKEAYDALVAVPVVLEPVTPEIVQDILYSNMEDISELSTAKYFFTNAAEFSVSKKDSWLPDWLTKKAFIQKWDGTITAGVHLNKLSVSIDGKIITITLPRAEILSYEVDYDSVEILDEKNNIFNPISVEDKVAFDAQTSAEMKARATENGLLERAEKNAQVIITNLLNLTLKNIEDYTIKFVFLDN